MIFTGTHILDNTNVRLHRYRAAVADPIIRNSATYADTTVNEIKAFIGVLILAAERKDNHLSVEELFDPKFAPAFYRCVFSSKRFQLLCFTIRFDDQETRAERMEHDQFTHIRELWQAVMSKCRESYIPGNCVTVDEQLIPFRGNCRFKIYMPQKPARYGIKIYMVCDSATMYCVDTIPYAGRAHAANNARGLTSTDNLTLDLLGDLVQPGRTLCVGNYYASFPLARELRSNGMHLVGTHRTKRELPSQQVSNSWGLKDGEATALYNHEDGISVLYKQKRK